MNASAEGRPSATRLGEVVQASSTEIAVHCYELYGAAPLGALVCTEGDVRVYAVVGNVTTAPLDPTRRPVARGADAEDVEAVYRDNPQLARLLRTEMQAIIVGYDTAQGVRHGLPPQPPRIHAFAVPCSETDLREFTLHLDFLPLLLSGSTPLADEVIAAFLRQASAVHEGPEAFLVYAGRELARVLARDLQRLSSILRSLRS